MNKDRPNEADDDAAVPFAAGGPPAHRAPPAGPTGPPPAPIDHPADPEDEVPFGDDEEDEGPAWDADDPRRQKDQMAPPREPCECYCLHCGRTFMSDQIWFQKVLGDPAGFDGF